MRSLTLIIFLTVSFSLHSISQVQKTDTLPALLKGQFMDDYGIRYTVTDSTFIMSGSARYKILQWSEAGNFLLTQNDGQNKSDPNLFTRIDYMQFSGMEPFLWGYCFTVYNAVSAEAALKVATADRSNPKTGCNGYPFSRMKRLL